MFFHFVKKGDSLYELSKKYNISIEKISNDNSLISDSNLVVNQCLLIDDEKNSYSKQTAVFNAYCYEGSNIDNVRSFLDNLTFLSIFSYQVKEDGTLNKIDDQRFIDEAKKYNVKPVMVITNSKEKGGFSPSLARKIISNNEVTNNLFNNILSIIKSKGYYGLNIDFEYVYEKDKDLFINFIKKAADFFEDYYLSISLAPKTSSSQKGLLYEAHDYEKLSKYVNHVILMTYEWGYTYGPSLPVAPFNKVQDVLEYATSVIDKNKIIMGLPNYGYDFKIPYIENQKAKSITNPKAIPLAFNNHAQIVHDNVTKTPSFKYKENNQLHEVQFDDPYSIENKLSLIDDLDIAGASIWTASSKCNYIPLLINHLYNVEKL